MEVSYKAFAQIAQNAGYVESTARTLLEWAHLSDEKRAEHLRHIEEKAKEISVLLKTNGSTAV